MKKINFLLLILSFTGVVNAQCWKDYSVGRYFSGVVKTDGTLWMWGDNIFGQLGNGNTTPEENPVQIGTDTDWKSISTGVSHTAAIKTDGTLWTWGINTSGELGNGTYTQSYLPVQVGTDTDWKMVNAAGNHTTAMKNDGSLWAWGYNYAGILGVNSSQITINVPMQIGQDTDWETFSSGYFHVLAIKENGSLWAWGSNGHGEIGTGEAINLYAAPVQISSTYDWIAVAIGDVPSSAALKNDGTLWTWGRNLDGQLGHGSYDDVAVPTQVGTTADWATVALGGAATRAIKTDGTLWAWGSNYLGDFGDGTTISSTIPVQIGTDTDWETVKINNQYSLAQKSDTSLWQIGIRFSTVALPLSSMNLLPEEIPCSMEITADLPFSTYPNPVIDQLNLLNTTGNPIEEVMLSTHSGVVLIHLFGDQSLLDLSALNTGIYNLTLISAGEQYHFYIYKN